jgi:RNase H-fold protein (predicted Holliday junction resolvase)
MPIRRVLAIDPGREKCGLAVLDAEAGLLERRVVARRELPEIVRDWCGRYHPDLLLLGSGTGSRDLWQPLSALSVPLRRVPERETTRRARQRYFVDHPPRGWRCLIPHSLQTPSLPIDDYAAWIIAEQFLADSTVD